MIITKYNIFKILPWLSITFITTSKDRKIKFGKIQTAILEDWIKSHEEFTYPGADDLKDLIESTCLTDKQIRVWLTNHRNVISLS